MPKQAFDDLDLSDEELAALEAEDEGEDEAEDEEDAPVEAKEEEDEDPSPTEDDADRSAEDPPPADDKAEGTEAADDDSEDELELEDQPRVRLPRLETPDLKKIDDEIAKVTAEQDGLTDKFVNGELEERDFQKEMAKVNRKIAQLYGDRAAATVKAEINKETDQVEVANSWESTVASFMTKRDNKTMYADGTPGFRLLDQELARLSQTDEGKKMSHAQLLVTADKEVRKSLQSLMKTMGAKLPEKNDDPEPKKRKFTRKPREGVVTLNDLPASDRTDDDEFSDIDKMIGSKDPGNLHKLEQLLASMTPEQQARYLEG